MSDLFEKNVGDLIRAGALPLDPERTARARKRFLHADRHSWKLAAAAAAVLIAVTIVSSARIEPPKSPVAAQEPKPATFVSYEAPRNDLLKGKLVLTGDPSRNAKLQFIGRSPLPDGLHFLVRTVRLEEQFVAGRLERLASENPSGHSTIKDGSFDYDFPYKGPGILRLEVSAKDTFQNVDVLKQMRAQEAEREWTFLYYAWTGSFLSRVEAQLGEAAALADDVRDLLSRVEAACATEERFLREKKVLIGDALRLHSRADHFAKSGAYPASARASGFVARDLATSMEIFKWIEGKFAGPRSYYTNHERGRDHRQVIFEFATLRTYVDEAVVIAGREFCLWMVVQEERPERLAAFRRNRMRPGIAEVAERLERGLESVHAADWPTLIGEIRKIAR